MMDDQPLLDDALERGPQYHVPALEAGALPLHWRLRRMLALAGLMLQTLLLTTCGPWSLITGAGDLRSWLDLLRWTAGWLLLVFAPLLLLGAVVQLQQRRPGAIRRSLWRSGLLGVVALLLLKFGLLTAVVAGATLLTLGALLWVRSAGAR